MNETYPPLAKLAYSIGEVVEITGLSRTSIYNEINSGRLRARKRGGRTLILRDDLDIFLRSLPTM